MTLDIPSQYEAILQDAVSSGAFASKEEALKHALDLLAVEQRAPVQKTKLSHQDWMKKVREWSESHGDVSHFIDDSRESIYEGRGE